MSRVRHPSLVLGAFVLVWLAPLAQALASPPHGEAAAGEPHVAESGAESGCGLRGIGDGFLGGPGEDGKTGFVLIVLNFVVLMLVLNKLLFRNLRRSNAEKSDVIRLELERATRARTEAEALVEEYEAKLAALETEVAEIRAAAKESAQAEHQRIIAEAHTAADNIKAAAARAAEREAARYRTALEHEIVDQAIARAETAIRASFAPADQRRLVDAWVDEVTSTSIGEAN